MFMVAGFQMFPVLFTEPEAVIYSSIDIKIEYWFASGSENNLSVWNAYSSVVFLSTCIYI